MEPTDQQSESPQPNPTVQPQTVVSPQTTVPPPTNQLGSLSPNPPPIVNQSDQSHKRLTTIVVRVTVLIVGGLLVYLLAFANKNQLKSSSNTTTAPTASQNNNSIDVQSRDITRKTDINALQGQVEAYNTNSGYYPTLENFNDPSWRLANMRGLDNSDLQDPKGTSEKLVSTPAANVYAYQVAPVGCDNTTPAKYCTSYVLTATLEGGGIYAKQGRD